MTFDQHSSVEPGPVSTGPRGIDIAAFILAIALPVVGLIVALVARSSARRQGRVAPGLVTAALIVSCIMTGLWAIGLVTFAAFALVFAQLSGVLHPANDERAAQWQSVSNVVLRPQWADGSALDDDEMNAASDLVAYRLDRAGIVSSGIFVDGDRLHITFDDAADQTTLATAADMLGRALRVDIRPVLRVGECDSSVAQADDDPAAQIALCEQDGVAELLLGPSEVAGASIAVAEAFEVSRAGIPSGDWGVEIALNPEGASAFSELTSRLVGAGPERSRLAIVVDGEVLSAPSVQAVITDGRVMISGSLDQAAAESLATQLLFASSGLVLQVESSTVVG